MAYTVSITYTGVDPSPIMSVAPISRIYKPDSSYIDTPVYTEGGPIGEDVDKVYGKSIYATNVDGWGEIDVLEPFASTGIPFPVPLAQFKLAAVGGTDNSVTFDVDDYKEAFYYMQLGKELADQGFEVSVTKN